MLAHDNFFVTPHAIEQFQKRIARLGDERTREVIRAGVSQAANVRKIWSAATRRRFGLALTSQRARSGNELPHSTAGKLFPDGEVE